MSLETYFTKCDLIKKENEKQRCPRYFRTFFFVVLYKITTFLTLKVMKIFSTIRYILPKCSLLV